jgi:tol-pal system-associated acyl-CoA thioesterase
MTAPTFTFPVSVYYEDTDAAGVVYYANYLKFMERARTEWLAHRGHPLAELEGRFGIVFVVSHADITFAAPARLGDRLDVGVAIIDHGGVRMVAQQDVLRAGVPLCTARITLACVDRIRMKPVRIPPSLLENLH